MYAIRSYYVEQAVTRALVVQFLELVEIAVAHDGGDIGTHAGLDFRDNMQDVDRRVVGPGQHDRRITSYNVCYTKLLRRTLRHRLELGNRQGRSVAGKNGVSRQVRFRLPEHGLFDGYLFDHSFNNQVDFIEGT